MSANPQSQPKAPVFKASATFEDVINKNPDFPTWAPEDKNALADMFFNEKYSDLSPEDAPVARTIFNKKYNVGQVGLPENVGFSGFGQDPNQPNPIATGIAKVQQFGDLATLGIPARSYDAYNYGLTDAGQQRDAQLAKYQTDPGLYGDLYRASQNPVVQNLAGLPGVFKQAGGLIGGIEKAGVSALGKAAPLVGKFINPNTLGASAYQGISNIGQAFQGKQNPVQALTNTALGVATAPIQFGNRIGNALAQGAAGGVQGGVSSALAGASPKEILEEAIRQAGINATIGGAFHTNPKAPKTPKSQPNIQKAQVKGFENANAIALRQGNKISFNDPQLESAATRKLRDIQTSQGVTDQATTQRQLAALKKQYEILHKVTQSPEAPYYQKQTATKLKGQVKAEYDTLYRKTAGKPTPDKKGFNQAVNAGIRARKQGGQSAVRYESYLNQFDKPTKASINAEIKKQFANEKQIAGQKKERAAVRRDIGKEKVKLINESRQQKALAAKERENALIKAEKKKQAEEKAAAKERQAQQAKSAQKETEESSKQRKQEELAAKAPPVLDNADIEAKSNQLTEHFTKNEKGSLEAKLTFYRKASKADFTKYGFSKERGEAINKSYQKLLDVYNQKKAASVEKPSAQTLKEGQEQNRLELAKLNEEGGKYNPGDKVALQKPARGLTLEDAQKTAEWDTLGPGTKEKARIAMDAAEGDSDVIIEYDAEKSGDTGQFKLKTVSPLSLDFVGDRLVMYATNKNGHTGTYYLSPSKPNADTGMTSYTHDITPLDETIGKAKKGLDSNIYWGQREVPVSEILSRPKRVTAGYTSQTEALLKDAYGMDANQLKRTLEKRLKNKEKVSPKEINEVAPAMDDAQLEDIYNSMDKEQKKQHWEEKTGDEC